jgi:hypothetical protein
LRRQPPPGCRHLSASFHRIDAQPSVRYKPNVAASRRGWPWQTPQAARSTPPMMTLTSGTFSCRHFCVDRAIAPDWPRSSAPFRRHRASTNVTTGSRNGPPCPSDGSPYGSPRSRHAVAHCNAGFVSLPFHGQS